MKLQQLIQVIQNKLARGFGLAAFLLLLLPTVFIAQEKIAFETTRDGNREIYVMNQDGTSQTNLTNNAGLDGEPAWGVTPINAPTDFRVDTVTVSQVSLAWTDNAGNEDGFIIERCTGGDCTSFVEIWRAGAGETVYTDGGLAKNTQYSYRIRAFNASGASAYTSVVSVKTLKK